MTSLIAIQHIFVEVQLKIEKMKNVFWAREFGLPNRYTGLPNGLDTSLVGYKAVIVIMCRSQFTSTTAIIG